ncbi:hypothetical protein RI129_002328 [Pyrocoelia pectoralis]|uniref:Cytochrome P450 n=1 Tax=Pyrocoelia pectoralis TaxID=417401 RepID=A0AAN7ZSX5_9COLE
MLTVLLFILFVTLFLIYSVKKPTNFPPGPVWLPIIGSSLQIKKEAKLIRGGQHVVFNTLCQKWNSNVVGIKLGEQLIVSVSNYSIIKDVLDNEDFLGRTSNFFSKLRLLGPSPGVTCAEGQIFKIQKKFILKNLHCGFDAKINDELEDLLMLINLNQRNIDFGKLVQPAAVNILWSLLSGHRLSRCDPKFQTLLNLLDDRVRAFDMAGGTLSNYPWLRFIAPEGVGYNLIVNLNAKLKNFIMAEINYHHQTWSKGMKTDLMYSFITCMNEGNEMSESFTDEQLLMISVDLFIAGAHSAGSTLDFVCLLMLLYPQVQRKVQAIVDKEFPNNCTITYSDQHKVPYIQAVIYEVIRFCHVLPMGGPRRALRDTVIDGYAVPKDTTVLLNLYSVMTSKEIWGDPENFRPERFIVDGNLHVIKEFIPFGIGRRRCLGESLARKFLFVFTTGLLRKYDMLPEDGVPLPPAVLVPGIVCHPKPYKVRFVPRKL